MEIDHSRQHFLERLYSSSLAVTFLFVALRLYTRVFVTKNFRLDDYVALIAWVRSPYLLSMAFVNDELMLL